MLLLDFDGDTVPMHDAPLERQAAVAEAEGRLLVNAFEGQPPLPASHLASGLRADGVAAVDHVLDGTTATQLRNHVNERLARSLDVDHGATHDGEQLLGMIMCREKRWDLKLDLAEPIVAEAFSRLLSAIGSPLVSLLGSGACLFELGALIVDEGAPRQPVHPDTPYSTRISVVSCVVALQDVSLDMGPTHFLPRTHTERSRAALWGSDPADDEEVAELLETSACRIPLPRCGDAVLFDARTLHCGSAHTRRGGPRRVLFYCSFRSARSKGWSGAGFNEPGTLLDRLRGCHYLSSDGRLVSVLPTRARWQLLLAAAIDVVRRFVAAIVLTLRSLFVAVASASVLSPLRSLRKQAAKQTDAMANAHYALVHTRGHLEVREPAHGAVSRFERVGIHAHLLPQSLCARLVEAVSAADASVWRVDRHKEHATTDIELDSVGDEALRVPAIAEFEHALHHGGAIDALLDDISRIFLVERSYLLLREMFIVRYAAVGGQQGALETHRDASWFSFVLALNEAGRDFSGGGTCLRGAPPLSVSVGSCLLFTGVQPHSAAPVTHGTRLVLAGFVDLRAPLRVRNACAAQMRLFDPSFVCSSCREFRRPHLRSNVRMLEQHARARGRQLLERLAARRVSLPCDVDLEPIEESCRRFLKGEAVGDADMRMFITRVLDAR